MAEAKIKKLHPQLWPAASRGARRVALVLEMDGEVVERADPHIGCCIAAPKS